MTIPECQIPTSGIAGTTVSRSAVAEEPEVVSPELIASGEIELTPFLFSAKKTRGRLADTCDVIFFRNGEEVSARVIEITEQEVSYRKCGMSDGPLFVSLKKDIFMIKYSNGSKQLFKQSPPPAGPAAAGTISSGPIDHPKMTLLCVLTGLSLLFSPVAIASLILGKRMLKEMDARPGVFRSRSLVQACVLVSLIVALLFLAYILLIFGIMYLF